MASYRISDAARRTGIPASTLRYYERIGLLPAPARTGAGYRAYEERTLDRLTFIARAKALGLRLDEIGELADLWDADRCAPVQDRLRDLIAARVADTRAQAKALLDLSSELSSFVDGLQPPATDAPCDENCGCHASVAQIPSSGRSLQMLPTIGTDLACTLAGEDVADRLVEWQALAAQATARVAIDGGIRLTFTTVDVRSMADLVAREQGCCSFLSFGIGLSPNGVTLDIMGPDEARSLVEALA